MRTDGNVVLEERPMGDTSSKATNVTSRIKCKIDMTWTKDNSKRLLLFSFC